MDIKILEHSDIYLITDLFPPDWYGIIPALENYTDSHFCFPIKVIIDNKIVGIGATIIHNDIAWLAHIIVHPEHRNKNIGKIITQKLIDISKEAHCFTIYLLATELGEPVYRKLGFETETEYAYFKGEQKIENYINTENIVAFNSEFKEQILDIDRQVSGEDRMVQLEQHLSNGFVYIQDNGLKGFYLPTFGDGLVIATTKSAGQELMKLRLKTKDFAAFPIDNIDATEFVQQNNFKEIRREKRMRLGKSRNWQPTNIYNRIGGNVG